MGRTQRKRCTLCRAVYGGTPGKWERCPDCGAEMKPIPYSTRRKAKAFRGR